MSLYRQYQTMQKTKDAYSRSYQQISLTTETNYHQNGEDNDHIKSSSSSIYDDPPDIKATYIPTITEKKITTANSNQNGRSWAGKIRDFPLIIGEARDNLVTNILSHRLRKTQSNEKEPIGPDFELSDMADSENLYDNILEFYEKEESTSSNSSKEFLLSEMEKETLPLTPRRHSPQSVNMALQNLCSQISQANQNQHSETSSNHTTSETSLNTAHQQRNPKSTFLLSSQATTATDLITIKCNLLSKFDSNNSSQKDITEIKKTTTGCSEKSSKIVNFFTRLFQRIIRAISPKSKNPEPKFQSNLIQGGGDIGVFKANRFSRLVITTPPPDLPVPNNDQYCASTYKHAEPEKALSNEEISENLYRELDECLEALAQQLGETAYRHKDQKSRLLYDHYCSDRDGGSYKYF